MHTFATHSESGGVIPFCGHLVAKEEPEAMVAMLRPFLARHAA